MREKMIKIFSSFILVLFLTSSPCYPRVMSERYFVGPFVCECLNVGCSCYLGSIKLGVSLERVPDIFCGVPCSGFYGEVISIDLPFLKVETLEESLRRAILLSKKSSTFSKKTSYYTTDFTNDKVMQILREKMTEASKTRSEKALIDLTTFFVTQLAKDISLQKNPNVAAIALTVKNLATYAKNGELADFLSFYFYLRAKHPEWLVSSNLDDSKKSPFPIHLLYNKPDTFTNAMLDQIFALEKLVELYIDVIKTRPDLNFEEIVKEILNDCVTLEDISEKYSRNVRSDNDKVYFLTATLVWFSAQGVLWGLDEDLHSFMKKRIASYMHNYMKFKNDESVRESIKKEVSNVISVIKQRHSQLQEIEKTIKKLPVKKTKK
jgi:hypothetical protein